MSLVAAADASNQPIFSRWRSPNDYPWTLAYVVDGSRRILSYHQNYYGDQLPPKSIWHSQIKCAAWIEEHRPGGDSGSTGLLTFNDNEIE